MGESYRTEWTEGQNFEVCVERFIENPQVNMVQTVG